VDQFANIDFALVQPPAFQSTSLTTQHLFQFQARKNPQSQPWNPTTMPDGDFPKMVNIAMSQAVADSAGFTYLSVGFLQENITSFPSSIDFPLNTTSFNVVLPALYKKYPNTPMMIHVFANNTPSLTITPAGATLQGMGELAFMVLPRGETPQPAFTLGTVVTLKGVVGVNGQNVTGQVSFLSAELSTVSSPYGPLDVASLQDLVNQMCQFGLVPWLNTRLGAGFPLPVVDGVALKNVEVSYASGYVSIGADFTYSSRFVY